MSWVRALSAAMLLLVSASAAAQQCSDGVDNNGNGLIDLTDWYCKAAFDNDESSFHSAIPGDDMNAPAALDCWFDGNSGSGDDGCLIHACCGIDGPCPADLDAAHFDPAQCTVTTACTGNCAPLTRTACDCFGCCEICTAATGCVDVFVNPVVSPACTMETIGDPASCRRCVLNSACRGPPSHIFIDGFEAPIGASLAAALRKAVQ